MKQFFIYRPKSGDRVVAENATSEVAVAHWSNGSRHVVGALTRLDYFAAAPKGWWRTAACKAAESVVAAVGGVAWDDQGQVSLVVPIRWALEAHRIMKAVGGRDAAIDEQAILASLVEAGLTELQVDLGGHLWFVPVQPRALGPAVPVVVSPPLRGDEEWGDRPASWRCSDCYGRFTAPENWGNPTITGGITPEEAAAAEAAVVEAAKAASREREEDDE